MQLKWLRLEHFRNYGSLELDFEEAPVLALVGSNAQGKTNLLESIAFLALGKSFRTHRPLEALTWERPHGRIKGMVDDTELEVFMQRSPEMKKVKKSAQITTPKDFLGSLRIVLFTPEHLLLVSGSPKIRRQYLDRTLVQLDPNYIDALGNLTRILRHRNALLKAIQMKKSQPEQLDLWDLQLEAEATKLWQKRDDFIDFLQRNIADLYREISATEDELSIHYQHSNERYDERLVAHREADIRTGTTSLGPHRDDFTLQLNAKPIDQIGSRGECRSAVLALKIAEMRYIEEQTGQKPLLLLDDVFSELDDDRQKQLGELLRDYQSVITTTSMDHLKGLKKAAIYEVSGGELLKK